MANEKRLTEATADCFEEVTKLKTYFAKIIAEGSAEKPYYSILYYNPTKKEYYIGYSSYDIANVFNWLSEWFEIVDDPDLDVVEVVRCKDCKHSYDGVANIMCGRCGQNINGIRLGGVSVKEEHFCSYGERKDNERKAD